MLPPLLHRALQTSCFCEQPGRAVLEWLVYPTRVPCVKVLFDAAPSIAVAHMQAATSLPAAPLACHSAME